jgi:hypothetical protein
MIRQDVCNICGGTGETECFDDETTYEGNDVVQTRYAFKGYEPCTNCEGGGLYPPRPALASKAVRLQTKAELDQAINEAMGKLVKQWEARDLGGSDEN